MSRARCTLKIQGLDCPNEVAALRAALEGQPGIESLGFDLILGNLTVEYEAAATGPERLRKRIAEKAGMKAEVIGGESTAAPAPLRKGEGGGWKLGRWGIVLASGVALAAGVGLEWADRPFWAVGCYLAAIVAGGLELAPKAFRALASRRLDMHVLMTIAVLGAAGLRQWDEAATVAFLFVLSEALEGLSLARARRAVRALLEVTPETAERIKGDGTTEVVPAREIQTGERVRVRAGERVPVDGRIVAGRSSLDQKTITGESVPIARGPGEEVYAGTVNLEGSLDVEAARPLDDAVVSRIIERVRAAQAGRTPIERGIERFAAIYTPIVVALAVVVMVAPPLFLMATGQEAGPEVWRSWFTRGLVVLVIACPCALVIATPVAVVSALASSARRGILIKGGQFLEAFGRLRVLAFDKTGTLTRGEPDVVEVVPAAEGANDEVLRIAAALGDRGGHVLGRAIARHARDRSLAVPDASDYQAVPGLGASGKVEETRYHIGSHRYIDEKGLCGGDFHHSFRAAEDSAGTAVGLTAPGGPLGWIRLADRPRREASSVVAELRDLGLEIVMLTGDNAPTAAAIGRELGIDEVRSNLLPADKASAVAEIDAARGPTGMVGDGVNDAPALAAARVSVALGGISSGAALETADIVLMADDLLGLPWLVRHSRRTLSRIRQNIALAVGAKLVVLVLAILGLATLWMAIAADLGASLVVTANALRLLKASNA